MLEFAAITLLSNSIAPSTCANCDSALRQVFAFCIEENIAPLHATPAIVIRYTAWLAILGTRAAISMYPYFSAVNKFFRDHQRQPIALGEQLADAKRGLEMLQHRLVPADTRLPLPAPVALNILLAANTLRDNLTWSPATLLLLERFKACLAVCVNCIFFCRAKTSARCQTDDFTVDRPSQQICLFVRKSKSKQRRDTPRQARVRGTYCRQPHPRGPLGLLLTAPRRFLRYLLQATTPCRLLELLTL
jgi:hypothetical protein